MTTLQLSSNGTGSPKETIEHSFPAPSGPERSPNLQTLFQEMVSSNASDLHLVAGRPPMLRAKGSLFPVAGAKALSTAETEAFFRAVAGSEERLKELWERKALDFAHEVPALGRFRVNAAIQQSSVSLTLRRIHARVPDFDELQLPSICKELAARKKGLILVTGPVNSGKSTTMAAMIEYINQTSARRIITIEDPVEYVYSVGKSLITQRELGCDVPSFAEGLRSTLR